MTIVQYTFFPIHYNTENCDCFTMKHSFRGIFIVDNLFSDILTGNTIITPAVDYV